MEGRQADPASTGTLPGYLTANAVAWFRRGKYEAQLNVYKLLNQGYIVSGHGSSPNLEPARCSAQRDADCALSNVRAIVSKCSRELRHIDDARHACDDSPLLLRRCRRNNKAI